MVLRRVTLATWACALLVATAAAADVAGNLRAAAEPVLVDNGGESGVPTYSLEGLTFKYDSDIRRERDLAAVGLGCDPCPPGEYMAAPCAGGNDKTPDCRACGGGCPHGEELVEPCGVANDRICAPSQHAACAKKAVTLDLGSLNVIMEDDCDNCATYLPHINTALKEGFMACPLRLCAYLAQVRHATAGLKVLRRTDFVYVAGAIHLQPQNFRLACKQMPTLKSAFEAKFTDCPMGNKCDCGGDAEASEVVGRPEYAFRAAVWWLAAGAGQVLGDPPCGDLRLAADRGLGGSPYWTSVESPGIGFQLLTTCISGYGETPGRQQLAEYYSAARSFFPDQDPDPSDFYSAASSAQWSRVAVVAATLLAMVAAVLA